MAVKNFGGNRSDAVNYDMRKIGNQMMFVTQCQPGDEGAIQLTRSKDGKNHKAGDVYYVKGGNAIGGKLVYIGVQDGFQGAARNLVVGLTENGGPIDFVRLPLVNEKNKINDATRRLLPALAKVDLGEELTLAAFCFEHKAGDEIKNKEGEVVGIRDSDGYSAYLNVYQEHMKTADNENGKISAAPNEMFVQERLVQKGRSLVALEKGEKAPEGAVITYDEGVAEQYAKQIVAGIVAKMPRREKTEQHAKQAAPDHVEDVAFGEEDVAFGDDAAQHNRPRG